MSATFKFFWFDYTHEQSRPRQTSLTGLLRNTHGFVALFLTAACMILAAILYVAFGLKESIRKQPDEASKEPDNNTIKLKPDKGTDVESKSQLV